MAKKRTHPEIEYFRGKIRELEALNKTLKRRLRKLEKREHMLEDLQEVEEEDPMPEILPNYCDGCGKGTLREVDFGFRVYIVCSHCSEKKLKK